MGPYDSGMAYQNYVDAGLKHWQRAYYGSNYPRLLAMQRRIDPRPPFQLPAGDRRVSAPAGPARRSTERRRIVIGESHSMSARNAQGGSSGPSTAVVWSRMGWFES